MGGEESMDRQVRTQVHVVGLAELLHHVVAEQVAGAARWDAPALRVCAEQLV